MVFVWRLSFKRLLWSKLKGGESEISRAAQMHKNNGNCTVLYSTVPGDGRKHTDLRCFYVCTSTRYLVWRAGSSQKHIQYSINKSSKVMQWQHIVNSKDKLENFLC